jgi:phosphatidylglycerol:prolipoprotein diacylglycerol transferase
MRPVLFSFSLFGLGQIKIDSYYLMWALALCLMVLWTKRRAAVIYGISDRNASDILMWTLCGVFIGATLGGYFDHWSRYSQSPGLLLRFWESGVSSGPGFIGGGLFGLFKTKRLGVSVDRFAESSSIPCSFMLFIGRIGCFLNGCCSGLPTDSPFGVRFPAYPGVKVFPSQIFESAAAFLIGILLVVIEKKRIRRPESKNHAVLLPMFLMLYGLYRIVFDFLRDGERIFVLSTGQYSGILALVVGIFWLTRSNRRLRRELTINGAA